MTPKVSSWPIILQYIWKFPQFIKVDIRWIRKFLRKVCFANLWSNMFFNIFCRITNFSIMINLLCRSGILVKWKWIGKKKLSWVNEILLSPLSRTYLNETSVNAFNRFVTIFTRVLFACKRCHWKEKKIEVR